MSLPAEGRAFIVIVRDSRQLDSQRPRPVENGYHLAPAYLLAITRSCRPRWRTLDQPGASTATEETAHGVDAPAGDVLAKRPDWQAWRWVWERGRHGPARGL